MIRLMRLALISGFVASGLIAASLFGQTGGAKTNSPPADPGSAKVIQSTPNPPQPGQPAPAVGAASQLDGARADRIKTATKQIQLSLGRGETQAFTKFVAALSASTKYRVSTTQRAQAILARGIATRQAANNVNPGLVLSASTINSAVQGLSENDIDAIFKEAAASSTGFNLPTDKAAFDKSIKEQNQRAAKALGQGPVLAAGGAAPNVPNPNLPVFNWTLPSSLYSTGIVTAVQNQNEPPNCQPGACWAFATVGAFEAAYALAGGGYIDGSEQYLINCASTIMPQIPDPNFTNQPWNCGGGIWAFAMFSTDPQAGGISVPNPGLPTRQDMPYLGSQGICQAPSSKPYQAKTWGYVLDGFSQPTTDQLKAALCTYGPIAVAVSASPTAWNFNSGDVITDIPNGAVGSDGKVANHAVVLVGWDDEQVWSDSSGNHKGAWMIKNSWGTGYGIPDANGVGSGFLYVAYGYNNLGLAAAYVVAAPPAGTSGN